MILAATRDDPHRLATMASPTGIFLIDASGELTFANPRLLEMARVPEERLLGLGFLRFVHPDDRDAIENRIAEQLVEGERVCGDVRLTCGRHREVLVRVWTSGIRDEDGAIAGLAGVLEEVTVALRTEEQARADATRRHRSERAESLGLLASGVAHEFNNLLVGITGNATLVEVGLTPGSEAANALGDLRGAAERATELTATLLACAGRRHGAAHPVPLKPLIEEACSRVRGALPSRARLALDLDATLPSIPGDVALLRGAVVHLLENARQALGPDGGEITVRASIVDVDESLRASLAVDGGIALGRHAVIEVRDTGCGMDAGTLERVFDPFFSTRPNARGLGLALVAGAARAAAGGIRVETAPTRGTTVQLLLPLHRAAPVRATPARAEEAACAGTVLVVDDERTVRDVTRRVLSRAGFEVLEAADGASAVKTYAASGGRVGCVLLDLSMPGIDGAETFRRLREVDPGARVVLTSGHCEQDVGGLFPTDGLAGFLQKPYDLASLLQMTKAVIAR